MGRARLLGLALVATVAVACEGEPSGTDTAPPGSATTVTTGAAPATPSRPAATPEGYRRIDVAAEGFTVDVPAGWQDVPYDPEAIRALVESSREANPELAALLESSAASPGGEAKLLVVDAGEPGANLNVLKVPNERPLTADELEEARDALLDPAVTSGIDAQLEAAGAQDIRREKAELTAGPALRASYVLPLQSPDGVVRHVAGVQYYVPAVDAVFILSLSTPDPAAYAADFDRIAQSFAVRPS